MCLIDPACALHPVPACLKSRARLEPSSRGPGPKICSLVFCVSLDRAGSLAGNTQMFLDLKVAANLTAISWSFWFWFHRRSTSKWLKQKGNLLFYRIARVGQWSSWAMNSSSFSPAARGSCYSWFHAAQNGIWDDVKQVCVSVHIQREREKETL